MKQTFEQYYKDKISEELLNEKLITFGNKRPKYNNIVILAGAGGSGKGFVSEKLIGTSDYKVFNVDDLKDFAKESMILRGRIKRDEYGEEFKGIDVNKLDLKNPDHTSLLHKIMKKTKLEGRQKKAFNDIVKNTNSKFKPNIMFDLQLKDMDDFHEILFDVKQMGYETKNINIVWVLNKLSVALKQNKERDRYVPEDILFTGHSKVALTMKYLMLLGTSLKREGLDGDIWIAFNAKNIDTKLHVEKRKINKEIFKKVGIKPPKNGEMTLSYVKDALLLKIKEKGKPVIDPATASKEIVNKILANNKEVDEKKLQQYLDVSKKIEEYPTLK